MCACGRSPREDGKCVGFHKLSEQEWETKKEVLLEAYERLSQDSSVGRAPDRRAGRRGFDSLSWHNLVECICSNIL